MRRRVKAATRHECQGSGFAGTLWSHKLKVFWVVAAVWMVYLGLTASRQPQRPRGRLSSGRSLMEASTLTGRLEALNFGQHPVDRLREAVQKSMSPGFGLLRLRDIQDDDMGEYDPLLKSVESITAQLLSAEEAVPCGWDPTLETDLRLLRGQKILLAVNFRNNEQLLPHVIVQLWRLLAILPEGSTFLSVYESDSDDSTGAWLEVLRQLVTAMRVPHRIVVGGNLTRQDGQDRVDFLALVRNAALEPLWAPTVSDGGVPTAWLPRPAPAEQRPRWRADRVVFMNDVFVCARDVVRLLLHRADVACGMDFDRRKVDEVPLEAQRHHLGKFLKHKYGIPQPIGEIIGLLSERAVEYQAQSEEANEFFRRELPLGFYDLWVGRDANGAMFLKDAPYSTDPYTLQRLPWGLPFPVKCCWNGLVALNATPFTQHNIRIRSHRQGECAASECSLLCNDFLRLGYQTMLVDPGVRQAYNVRDARDLYQTKWVRGINITSWADVTTAPPIDTSLVPFRPYSQCCGLREGGNQVEFDKDCAWDNFLTPNYTAMPDLPRPGARNASAVTGAQPSAQHRPAAARRSRYVLLS